MAKSTQLHEFNSLEGTHGPGMNAVRLDGDGWYIEIRPAADGSAIDVRCGGIILGEGEMVIRPHCSNGVRISCDAARAAQVHIEAVRIAETWKANEEHDTMRKKVRKKS